MRAVFSVASICCLVVVSSTCTLAAGYLADEPPGMGDESYYGDSSNGGSLGLSSEDHGYFEDCERIAGILPSDHSFDRFISPLSNPFFFEDPRSLTEFRGVFLNNELPGELGNGDVQVWAAQLRGRLTERWSVIAPRWGTSKNVPTTVVPARISVHACWPEIQHRAKCRSTAVNLWRCYVGSDKSLNELSETLVAENYVDVGATIENVGAFCQGKFETTAKLQVTARLPLHSN